MLQLVAVLLALLFIRFFYVRYVPTYNVNKMDVNEIKNREITLLDIRDFNVSYKDPIDGAVNIPLSYLERGLSNIPTNKVFVVSSDFVGKNLCIRLLRRNKIHVIGYTIRKEMSSSTIFSRFRNNNEGVAS